MRLDDLCEVFDVLPFPKSKERQHPQRQTVLAARSRVGNAVIDDEFLLDCIVRELRRLRSYRISRGLEPFFIMPNLGIRFAFGYWPPGATAGPHEHTAWNITAVWRNRLEVLTYDREASYRQKALIPKHRFDGNAGMTGFIYDPCIHEPRNTSPEWSLSFHVTSPRDGERPADYEELLSCLRIDPELSSVQAGHPYASVITTRHQQRFVDQLARTLCSMNSPQARRVLVEARGLASSATQKWIDRAVPELSSENASGPHWMLTRAHSDLILIERCQHGFVSLNVETPNGCREELVMSDIAREAIAFVSREQVFEVHQLPGSLSQDERIAIGEALEETGLFRRGER